MEAALVAMLVPVLPFLLKAGERMASDLAGQLGESAAQFVVKVWGRIGPSILGRPGAREAAQDVASEPTSDAIAALRQQLKKVLDADGHLRGDIKVLIDEGSKAGILARDGSIVASDGSIVVGNVHAQGNVRVQTVRADGQGIAAGRDVIQYNIDPTGWERIRRARGPAKWLMVSGIAIVLAGFAVFGFSLVGSFSGVADVANECLSIRNLRRRNECMLSQPLGGMSLQFPAGIPFGFGVMIVGFIVFGAGSLMALRSND